MGAGTYNVAFVTREAFYNQNFYKKCGVMVSRLRLRCGGCKPEKAKPKTWLLSPRKPADET